LLILAKFREVPQQYQNSMENGKFRGLAQNSVTRGKLWALVIIVVAVMVVSYGCFCFNFVGA